MHFCGNPVGIRERASSQSEGQQQKRYLKSGCAEAEGMVVAFAARPKIGGSLSFARRSQE